MVEPLFLCFLGMKSSCECLVLFIIVLLDCYHFMQIEHRRAYNCEIMLSKVKVPLHELMVSYIELCFSILHMDL